MAETTTAVGAAPPADRRSTARRGLAVYFGLVVVISGAIEAYLIMNPELFGTFWVLALMWSPALASVIARLVLREGFSDVSFRFGGLRTLPWYALGLGVPLAVGILAYGAAWLTGLVGPSYRTQARHLGTPVDRGMRVPA